jgi:hypothetical protein
MTHRRSPIRKRADDGPLCVNVEMAAAGYFNGFWREPGMELRSYWESVALIHGDRIKAKMQTAMPGCRPAFDYAMGLYPPIPLIGDPPPEHYLTARQFIDIDGVRFWYCGSRWQPSQADHLRGIGEIDGREWQRYIAWKRTGFEARYELEDAPPGPVNTAHMCS